MTSNSEHHTGYRPEVETSLAGFLKFVVPVSIFVTLVFVVSYYFFGEKSQLAGMWLFIAILWAANGISAILRPENTGHGQSLRSVRIGGIVILIVASSAATFFAQRLLVAS